jgi:hypothetical protein
LWVAAGTAEDAGTNQIVPLAAAASTAASGSSDPTLTG